MFLSTNWGKGTFWHQEISAQKEPKRNTVLSHDFKRNTVLSHDFKRNTVLSHDFKRNTVLSHDFKRNTVLSHDFWFTRTFIEAYQCDNMNSCSLSCIGYALFL